MLKAKNTDLKEKTAGLKARLISNSVNSNKPPSSDEYRKKPALSKQTKGKHEGQKWHKGTVSEGINALFNMVTGYKPMLMKPVFGYWGNCDGGFMIVGTTGWQSLI